MKIKSIISQLMLMILIGTLSGCASIVNGRTQQIPVTSYPEGATVYVNGHIVGCTPMNLILDRKYPHEIIITKSDYSPANFRLTPRMNPWIAGNILLGSVAVITPVPLLLFAGITFAGVVTDCITGGAYHLSRSKINVPLSPQYL